MPDSTADGPTGGDTEPPAGDPLGSAVDDAMNAEIKRQKARFVQQILGLDRIEGVGRAEEQWADGFDRRHDNDGPDDPRS